MKGIVTEIKDRKAVILTDKGSFISVSDCGYALGETIEIKPKSYRKVIAVAASLVLVCMGFGGYGIYMTPSAYVDMDINPSIRLAVNCFERVIDIQPLNEDAYRILKRDIRKNSIADCMNDIVTVSEEMGFLNEENKQIDVQIQTESESMKETVTKSCAALKENGKREITLGETDKEAFESATVQGISMGKYKKEQSRKDMVQPANAENQKPTPIASFAPDREQTNAPVTWKEKPLPKSERVATPEKNRTEANQKTVSSAKPEKTEPPSVVSEKANNNEKPDKVDKKEKAAQKGGVEKQKETEGKQPGKEKNKTE